MSSPPPSPSHPSTAIPSIDSGGDVRRLLHTLIHRHCVFSGMHNCAARMEESVQMLTSEQMSSMGISEEPAGQFLLEWFTIYNEMNNFRGSPSSLEKKLTDTARKISNQHGMRAPPPPPKACHPLQKRLKRKASEETPRHRILAPQTVPHMIPQMEPQTELQTEDNSWNVENISNELACRIDEYHLRLMALEECHQQIPQDQTEGREQEDKAGLTRI